MTQTEQSPPSPTLASQSRFRVNLPGRYRAERLFQVAALLSTLVALVVLAMLLGDVLIDGLPRLSWDFLTSFPSRRAAQAGILSPLVGTIWLLVLTALFAIPIGVGAGIFLEEFAANTGRSVLSGGLTLALLVLPIIIVATREALRAVPNSIRQAGFALGTTRWQVVRDHVLPVATPGILTGTILALSRAIGETAPLVTIGALTFIAFLPPLNPITEGLRSPFTALPIQIYNWVSRPQPAFQNNAAAAIIVLMVVLLLMNATAIYLRSRTQQIRND